MILECLAGGGTVLNASRGCGARSSAPVGVLAVPVAWCSRGADRRRPGGGCRSGGRLRPGWLGSRIAAGTAVTGPARWGHADDGLVVAAVVGRPARSVSPNWVDSLRVRAPRAGGVRAGLEMLRAVSQEVVYGRRAARPRVNAHLIALIAALLAAVGWCSRLSPPAAEGVIACHGRRPDRAVLSRTYARRGRATCELWLLLWGAAAATAAGRGPAPPGCRGPGGHRRSPGGVA